jgi:beta-glucanase (GH16 family)
MCNIAILLQKVCWEQQRPAKFDVSPQGGASMIVRIHSRFVWRANFALATLFLTLAVPGRASAQASAQCTNQGVGNSTTGSVMWTPQFCQEFNGVALTAIDTTVWVFEQGNNNGWGNNEVEVYCGPPSYPGNDPKCPNNLSTSNNAYIDGNGHLVIQAINNSGTWLSTRMKTLGLESFTYGRIEANIQLPDTTSQGLWPAFWSLGTNITTVSWPTCGEDDFMEVWSPQVFSGPGPGGNISTIHTKNTDGAGVQTNKHNYTFPSGMANNTAFHKYGVIWSANMVQHYVDDPTHPFYIATTSDLGSGDLWPFNASIFILLNLAVGGTLGGNPSGLASPLQPYLVDYVRQYKASASVPAPVLPAPPSITVKAGATTGNSTMLTPGLTSGTGFVYLTCSTNAPKASCAVATNDPVSPFVVNSSPPGTAEAVTVTVTTTANAIVPPLFFTPENRIWLPVALAGLLALIAIVLAKTTPRRAWRYGFALIAVCIVVGIWIAGCSGNNSPPPPTNGTPPGSYTVTVYAFTESNTGDGSNASADAHVDIPLSVN